MNSRTAYGDPKISKFQCTQIFPFLIQAPPEFKKEFEAEAQYKKIPAGTTVFWEGDRCQSLALIISGQVRVYKLGESGRVNPVKIIHREIAGELGSAREVISRILKDFEEEKIISLNRGAIQIENQQALIRKSKMV